MTEHDPGAGLPAARSIAELAFDTAEVVLLALDREGRVVLVNRYGGEVLGWPPADLAGRDWFTSCLPEGIRPRIRRVFEVLLESPVDDRATYHEVPVMTRAGTERLIEWHTTLLRDQEGRVIGTLSSGTDVSQRLHLQDTLEQERLRVFRATMRTVQGILNNFLNGLQLAHLEVEGQLPSSTTTLVDALIQDAAAQVRALSDLETVSETDMVLGPGIKYQRPRRDDDSEP